MTTLSSKLQQGIMAFQAGNSLLAEKRCYEVLQIQPVHADAFHLLALINKKKQNFQQAELLFSQSIKANHNQPIVHLNFANLLFSLHRFDQAISHYKTTLSFIPAQLDALYNLANLYNQTGEFEQALTTIKLAINANSSVCAYFNVLGSALKNLTRFDEALAAFDQSLALQPADFFAWHNKGVTYRLKGDAKNALFCYDKIMSIGGNVPELHFNSGCAFYDIGQVDAAEQALKKAIMLRPDYVLAHETLNNLYWENANTDKFLSSYQHYLKSNQQATEDMHFSLVAQLILSKQEDDAIDAINIAMKTYGQSHRLAHALAVIYRKKGIYSEQAIALIYQAIKQQPDNARYRIDLANILIHQGNYHDALMQLDFALQQAPLNQEIWAYKGICWRLLNDERSIWLNDYQRFIHAQTLEVPQGYDNLEHFMFELTSKLNELHNATQQPLDQSVMGGTQTMGNLLLNSSTVIQDLNQAITSKARNFINSLPKDDNHPFLSRITHDFKISGCWSVRLSDKGFHTNHVHPDGWLSGPTYVSVPPSISPNDPEKSGWVKFGETSLGLGEREHIGREICPQPGVCVFFPSYMWHGTHTFNSDQARITTPCDIHPVIA